MFALRFGLVLLGFVAVGHLGAGCCPSRSEPGSDLGTAGAAGGEHSAQGAAWVKLAATGSLPSLVKAEVAKARTQALKPIVYVGAGWCEPCRAIHTYRRDATMVEAFRGTYVIELDVDDWGPGDLTSLGYETKAIPVFLSVGDSGSAKGPKIDGGAWGDNIPENMAPPLKQFFAGVS
jgi:hypothetical protein